MSVVAFLRHGLRLVVPLAVAITIYLYMYPVFQGCAFPIESGNAKDAFELTKKLHWPASRNELTEEDRAKLAPFRLLALGDPQLEGDTSIPTSYLGTFPHLKEAFKHATFQTSHSSIRERGRKVTHELVDVFFDDIFNILESLRKRFDHLGNDFYLAHIYRTVHWWSQPTHVTVLGDLLGSQWIDDAEFAKRSQRFWNRTFKGAERLSDDLAAWPLEGYTVSGYLDGSEDEKVWSKRLLNVAGNHDIGYAGDLTEERLERFERAFGKANYDLHFQLPVTDPEHKATMWSVSNLESERQSPEIRIITVNDMNLDTPAISSELQDATYNFINAVISTSKDVKSKGTFTLLLTHIPMYKPKGICVDSPFFDFFSKKEGGGVKEQNQLSADASKGFLEGIWGMAGRRGAPGGGYGRPGLMLNGHDHEGCDTYHFINQTNGTSASKRSWEVVNWDDALAREIPGTEGIPGRREITVRSMMGDFGGNAGLLSMWFDFEEWEWQYEYTQCPLGTQHFWWFVHIVDFIVLIWIVVYGVVKLLLNSGVDVDAKFNKAVSCAFSCLVAKFVGRSSVSVMNGKAAHGTQ